MGDSKWRWFYEICRVFSLFVGCSLNPFGSWRRLPAGIPYLGNVRLVGRDCEALWWKRGAMGSKRSVWCGAAFKEWQEAPCSIRSDTILREPAIRKKAPAGTGAFSITEQGYGRLRSNNSGRSASRKGSVRASSGVTQRKACPSLATGSPENSVIWKKWSRTERKS